MNFYEFTILSDNEQFDLVFKKGKFIDFNEIGKSRFVLYKLCGFFVEIQYEMEKNRIIEKVVFQK